MCAVASDLQKEAVRILEEWALMMVEPAESSQDQFDREQGCLVGSLHFEGVISGSYFIICQSGFAETLAANLLGDPESGADLQAQKDALGEMVNVLSGNMLTRSYGEDTVFALTSPNVHETTIVEVEGLFKNYTIYYKADGHSVAICFAPDKVKL